MPRSMGSKRAMRSRQAVSQPEAASMARPATAVLVAAGISAPGRLRAAQLGAAAGAAQPGLAGGLAPALGGPVVGGKLRDAALPCQQEGELGVLHVEQG